MKVLRLIAIGYVLKTLLLGVAWLMVPDLPARAAAQAKQAWARVSGTQARP